MLSLHSTLFAGAAVLALPGLAAAATVNWPQPGMNAAHTGFNTKETSLSAANVASLTRTWSFATGAEIDANPVMVGKRVYVLSEDGNLYALNATTGKQLWTYNARNGSLPTTWGLAASPTLVFVNCQIDYNGSGDGYTGHAGICALDPKTGAQVWTWAIYYEGTTPELSAPYGPPVLTGNTIYMGESDSGSFAHVGYFVQLDAATGAHIGTSGNCGDGGTVPNACNFVSPAPPAASGATAYYVSGSANTNVAGVLCSLTGAGNVANWCDGVSDGSIAPALSGGRVYFAETTSNGASNLVAVAETDGTQAWSVPVNTYSGAQLAPAVASGLVYFEVGGSIFAVKVKTGSIAWSKSCAAGGCLNSGLTLANGVAYAQCYGVAYGPGNLCAFDAKTGALLANIGPGGPSHAAPIVANGAVFSVCGYDNLCRYDPGAAAR